MREGAFLQVHAVRPVPGHHLPAEQTFQTERASNTRTVSSDSQSPTGTDDHLSRGRAVHARLCEVPAEICWMATPSRPTTFFGLVMGPVELPWPHWPMELLPQAYTSLSIR